MKTNILGCTRAQLSSLFASLGEPAFRATQVFRWIHQKGETDFKHMTNLSRALQERLSEAFEVRAPTIRSHHLSSDGTRKWILEVDGGGAIETVYIPEPKRATLCISSQVGCMLNCSFCCTAQQGFQKNLTAAEVIGQLWLVVHLLKQEQPHLHHPITNVVMMGMGEPLLNYDNVLSALRIMREDLGYGLSKRRVTVSTSGVVPALEQLIQDTDVALAISLHAPDDALRNILVPINKKYPIATLLSACHAYLNKTPLDLDRHITIEYVMLSGVNDSLEQAESLARLLKGLRVKINLIPFNRFPGTQYQRSNPEQIEQFSMHLRKRGFLTFGRKTRGDSIDAACGQLAGQVIDKTTRQVRYQAKLSQEQRTC